MGIRTKLFLGALALAAPTIVLVGALSYLGGKAAVEETTLERLTAVRAGKAHRIEEYFEEIRSLARVFARDRMIVDAMANFDAAHQELFEVPLTAEQRTRVAALYADDVAPRLAALTDEVIAPSDLMPADDADLYLQYHYIVANEHSHLERDLLDDAGDDSEYTAIHRVVHPVLRDFVHEFGFRDLILISGSGHVVYTVSKKVDLGISLVDGPYRDTNLAEAFHKAEYDILGNAVQLVDFAAYPPSFGEPAAFMSAPIVDGAWLLGVLALQMPVGEIDAVMTSHQNWRIDGLGDTGETFLVGPDFRMRSNSRFFLEDPMGYIANAEDYGVSAADLDGIRTFGTTILHQEVRTDAAEAGLAGNTATTTGIDYRGEEVLTSYAPLAIEGVEWAILSEIDVSEAFGRVQTFTRNLVLRLAGLMGLVLIAAWAFSRRFVAPIVELDEAAGRFAAGEEDVEVPVTGDDELGSLGRSFNRMVSAIRQNTHELTAKAEELEGVSSVILRWGTNGRIRFINDFGLALFGFSVDELVGQPLAGTIIPASDEVDRNIREMIDGIVTNPDRYEIDETENRRKNGERIWMAWRNTPILKDDGSLREILTIGIDITQRKRAESELRKLSRAVEQSSSTVVITDLAGNIEYANPKFSEITGYSFEEAVGLNPRVLKSGIHPPAFYEDLWATIASGREWHGEFCNRKKNGDLYWEAASISPVRDASGDITHYVAIKDDITERKRMEEELEEARDAAEAANRAKSTFLANMSHELRTPMNAIIGYSEMLAEDAEDEGHDDMIPDLEKINAAGKHLLALINDILDLSKIEAGRMDLYLETFDLADMLHEAVSTVTPIVTKNRNRLVTDVADDLGTVHADLTKLRQALFNLLSNAAKFTEDGTITLAASRERREGGDWILLSVADTGIGISPKNLEKVFEEFSQADDSTTRDFGGTGLGLPISRRFCQMMGGDITVSSTLGAGATFTIEVPAQVDAMAAAKAAVDTETKPAPDVAPGVRPILVVDDDPASRDLIRRTLEAEGFEVICAATAEEGLQLARSHNPSLMTLDVLMPSMDGWLVLQEIKADPELEHIPVIMISIAGDRDLGYTLGAVECLTKPVDRDRLREVAGLHARPVGGGHALVVDDDDGIRSLFHRALAEDGWTVAEAPDGAVALDLAREQRPDLVLLDLMMPVMDGFEFVMHFRKLEGCDDVPVIVVTAKDLDRDERELLLGRVERIVEKGALTRQQILRQVGEMISKNDPAPAEATPNTMDTR